MKINTKKYNLLEGENIFEINEEEWKENIQEEEDWYYTYELARILDISEEDVEIMCKNYPEKTKKEILDERENRYTCKLANFLNISQDDVEIICKNYPYYTKKEILEYFENQENYDIRFCHQHEWVDEDLIKKYLLLDEYDSDIERVTLETPELHDCNLIRLTPELQKKAYRWRRWNRNTTSHLIDRKDCPKENRTNKLTIVWKRECEFYYDEDWEKIEEPYFLVITAFWWEWKSKKEIRDDEYGYNFDIMEYWINHALIPEKWDFITKTEEPHWVHYYKEKSKK